MPVKAGSSVPKVFDDDATAIVTAAFAIVKVTVAESFQAPVPVMVTEAFSPALVLFAHESV